MIFAVVAQTGGGKSYLVTKKALDFLRDNPTGHVVTNIPLLVDEICDYFTKEEGSTLNAAERIRLLNLDEVWRFWMCYGQGFTHSGARKSLPAADGSTREQLDLDEISQHGFPTFFGIDESDEIFDAKLYAKVSHDLKHFTRHNRKLVSEVYFIAPSFSFLLKEIREMCHGVWVMENGQQMKLGKIPLVGSLFKGAPWIKGTLWKVRAGGAFGGLGEQPREVTRFTIDPKGVGRCYKTEGGLGVTGNASMVRKAEKVKGLPMWALGIPAVAVAAALFFVPRMLGAGVSKVSASVTQGFTNATAGITAVVPKTLPAIVSNTAPNKLRSEEKADQEEPPIRMTGVGPSRKPGVGIIYFSDGSTRTTADPDFGGFLANGAGMRVGCRIGGKTFTNYERPN